VTNHASATVRRRTSPVPREHPRPLLKWAGGKRQLLPILRRFYPEAFSTYFEPFLGSAAVFFDLWSGGRVSSRHAHLTDWNSDLIACYAAVRDDPDAVIDALHRLQRGHRRDGAEHYYRIRERFNTRRRLRVPGEGLDGSPALAAMLIYLNRTGYNGLFRLNAAGEFNVPAGRYDRPVVCNPDLVRSVARAFNDASLGCCQFDDAVISAAQGDLLYFDPPYEPLSATARFGAYTAARFSMQDQERLCEAVIALGRRGCFVIVSNSSADSVQRLYMKAATSPSVGFGLWRVPAKRAINSRATSRGPVPELLFTNLDPRSGTGSEEMVRLA
jgi:DNA adenine methylase